MCRKLHWTFAVACYMAVNEHEISIFLNCYFNVSILTTRCGYMWYNGQLFMILLTCKMLCNLWSEFLQMDYITIDGTLANMIYCFVDTLVPIYRVHCLWYRSCIFCDNMILWQTLVSCSAFRYCVVMICVYVIVIIYFVIDIVTNISVMGVVVGKELLNQILY